LNAWTLKDLGIDAAKVGSTASAIQAVSNLAPVQERKGVIIEAEADEAVEKLVNALRKEGALP
jgi:electron transfer flavoprotein alpha/beta subunit